VVAAHRCILARILKPEWIFAPDLELGPAEVLNVLVRRPRVAAIMRGHDEPRGSEVYTKAFFRNDRHALESAIDELKRVAP
jgi:hypothetical protein